MQEYRKNGASTEEELAPAQEGFEDVGLNDEPAKQTPPPPPQKKKGLFARFGDNHGGSDSASSQEERSGGSGSSHLHFGFSGRKRGQSGQGAELKSMERGNAQKVVTEVA
jgi:hypothetical protein